MSQNVKQKITIDRPPKPWNSNQRSMRGEHYEAQTRYQGSPPHRRNLGSDWTATMTPDETIVDWICTNFGYPYDITFPDNPIPEPFRKLVEDWWVASEFSAGENEIYIRQQVAEEGHWPCAHVSVLGRHHRHSHGFIFCPMCGEKL